MNVPRYVLSFSLILSAKSRDKYFKIAFILNSQRVLFAPGDLSVKGKTGIMTRPPLHSVRSRCRLWLLRGLLVALSGHQTIESYTKLSLKKHTVPICPKYAHFYKFGYTQSNNPHIRNNQSHTNPPGPKSINNEGTQQY